MTCPFCLYILLPNTKSWSPPHSQSTHSPFDIYFMTFSISSLLHYIYIFHDSFRSFFLPRSLSCLHYFNKLYFLDGNGIIRLSVIWGSGGVMVRLRVWRAGLIVNFCIVSLPGWFILSWTTSSLLRIVLSGIALI